MSFEKMTEGLPLSSERDVKGPWKLSWKPWGPFFAISKVLFVSISEFSRFPMLFKGKWALESHKLKASWDFLVAEKKNVVLGCAGWKDRFNLEDTLFAGAVINRISKNFDIHCDSSLMAETMFIKNKNKIIDFAPKLTHYHRLVERFGLIEDIKFCLTNDVANVLPLYNDGKLVAK